MVLMDNHDTDSAIEVLVKAVNLAPEDPYACFNLGQAYEEKRLLPEAKACYQRAGQHAPKNSQISRFVQEAMARLK